MDPLSQLFAAYLEMVSNNITNAYIDAANTTVTAQTLTYKGTDIRFQHFLWQVKQESVCADLKQQATSYSKCTLQAKAMFTDLCNQLSGMKNLNSKGRSLSRMYCNASLNYKPMIAMISAPARKTEQQLKDKECNQLILKAMQDSSPELAKHRDKVCAEAK
ncbi:MULTISPECIES: hypothetical protein [Shewanella]|uniref:Uncharacterized protein n=2 Tax=Unclassified Bacteria TaxID=49928 RepID=A0AAU6VMK9_UNCXX|nr:MULTISPECIES: hypothetical protein [Shewanella]MCT8983026.1 hypothetical protein [Shewanella algae]MDE0569003.1 hypothetical protein [Shewanella sp. K8]TVP06301.1 hypothetical protein AYI73_11055 [Shewanella algae]BCV40133.1 hypothetical protein TUM17378_13950 [Shewanella algae]